ncbi:MAG: hypothetical protein JSW50_13325 [Candidatus Latescibacterota bacterium]|nr:MAG: hypothetical protein JSW50_13325 [Candidatus Latescibacterota bacterium]
MNHPAHQRDDLDTALLADHERWYAAIGYMFILCFFSLWKGKESDFVRFHARQAFLLFVAECASFLAILLVDATLGRLPFLGLLIVILLQIVVYLAALFLSVTGFVKALFGERWVMPFLGAYGERVPLM